MLACYAGVLTPLHHYDVTNYVHIACTCTCMSYSDEDTDVRALISAWLKALPVAGDDQQHSHSQLEGWLEDYFYQALDWIMKANDFVVDTTLVGVAMNGLSHLVNVTCKPEFVCALIRGLGGNLQPSTREKFAKEVFQWAHETPPDHRRPLDTYYDTLSGRLSTYQLQVNRAYSTCTCTCTCI